MRCLILAAGLLAAGLLATDVSVAADTYRSGTRVISVGDSATKLSQVIGSPAFKEPIESKQGGREGERWQLIRSVLTNANGRSDEPLLIGESYKPGEYELVLHAQAYFERRKAELPTPPFLSTVPVRIRIADASQRFHLPIQLGPWSYSYSRGS